MKINVWIILFIIVMIGYLAYMGFFREFNTSDKIKEATCDELREEYESFFNDKRQKK